MENDPNKARLRFWITFFDSGETVGRRHDLGAHNVGADQCPYLYTDENGELRLSIMPINEVMDED